MDSQSVGIRTGKIGAMMTIFGVIFSGPLSIMVVGLVKPQPKWVDSATFIENFHWIQSLPFFFGFALVSGSVLMVSSLHILSDRKATTTIAVIFSTIAATMIFLNYVAQTTFVPAQVEAGTSDSLTIISMVSMSNPNSFAWAMEMWGYGFLGIALWLVSGVFERARVERLTRDLFILNGIISVLGALWTGLDLDWVLTLPGLIAFGVWNILYLVIGISFWFAMCNWSTNR